MRHEAWPGHCARPVPAQVFICYARRDFPFVRDVARAVTEQGMRVWFDVLDMAAGENYVKEIDAAIAASDCFVVVVSPYSMASAECQREITVAAGAGKRIAPLLLQAAVMPDDLRLRQWIDFRSQFERPMAELSAWIRDESRPMDFALAYGSLPKPLNLGDRRPLAEIDCPVQVKVPLLLLCASAVLFMMLCVGSAKQTGWVGPATGIAYAALFFWYAFRIARRRTTFAEATSLAILALPTLLALRFTRPEAGEKMGLPFFVSLLAVVLGLLGAGLMLTSRVFRRWMVAYSHEPGAPFFRLR